MTPAEYGRLKNIVAGALALPEGDRAAYVAARCGPDVAARTEAQALLAAAVQAAALYEDPTFVVNGATLTLDDLDQVGVLFELPSAYIVRDVAVDDGFGGNERYGVRRQKT